jgi:hypothetical protein
VPSVLLLSITKLAFSIGITNPVWQLRVALMIFALFSFLTLNFCTQNIFSTEEKKKNSLFLVSFYFLAPLFLTRLMIESLSAPWLLLSGLFATRYYNNKKILPLFLSVLFLCVASIFRFQAGSCLLALPVLILFNKKYSHFLYLIIFGALFFILTGLIDQFIYGQFHRSLLSYIQYNLHSSSSYGVTPFYTYLILFIGLTIPPAFLLHYKKLDFKKEYHPLFPVFLYFLFFVFFHSCVPHKEERFMVPVFSFFLILLTPLFGYIQKNNRYRTKYFIGLNFLLLFFTVYNVPQKNVIDFIRFFDSQKKIKHFISYKDSILLYPEAFALSSPTYEQVKDDKIAEKLKTITCDQGLVIRKDYLPTISVKDFNLYTQFDPGLLEAAVIKLNPKQNIRRNTLYIYLKSGCNG